MQQAAALTHPSMSWATQMPSHSSLYMSVQRLSLLEVAQKPEFLNGFEHVWEHRHAHLAACGPRPGGPA